MPGHVRFGMAVDQEKRRPGPLADHVDGRAARFYLLCGESRKQALAHTLGLQRRQVGKSGANARSLTRARQFALQVGRRGRRRILLIDVASGRIDAMEALVRHPERGLVPPDEFIPLAEETGLIRPIGAWILRQACADAATWPMRVRVAVNVSAAQFKGPGLLAAVSDALSLSSLPPDRLELEITETALLADADATLSVLRELRASGVRIAMDDFGTGYSSLGYLRSFPFDKIKIDRSLSGTWKPVSIARLSCALLPNWG